MNISFNTMDREFWGEFLDLYKELPALWRVKSSEYRNRAAKANGYELLVNKLREYIPNADRDMVVKKINNFRTNYRKELRKVKRKANTEDSYQPSLWYFQKLSFLEDQEDEDIEDNNLEKIEFQNVTLEPASPKKAKKIKYDEKYEQKLIKLACERLQKKESSNTEEDTDADIQAKSWALQYKKLTEEQKIIARKIISDVLFHGCLGSLDMSHAIDVQQLLARNPFP